MFKLLPQFRIKGIFRPKKVFVRTHFVACNTRHFLTHLKRDVFSANTLDIYSKGKYPANILSNFRRCSFTLDGVQINSLEGFLQSLKTNRLDVQLKTCTYANAKAKRMGSFLNFFYDHKTVYWQGKAISRFSSEYQNLLKRAYEARYLADFDFRKALFDSRFKRLIHSMGKKDKKYTILTENEFISMLNHLRRKYIYDIIGKQ